MYLSFFLTYYSSDKTDECSSASYVESVSVYCTPSQKEDIQVKHDQQMLASSSNVCNTNPICSREQDVVSAFVRLKDI